ncbi:MAG: hypothetical protein ACF8OB_01265 [Phycisphaeraceae bacterium JB051]
MTDTIPCMRIITRKLHRAFAELDSYTDDQCRQYLKNIKQKKLRFSLRLILLPLIITLLYFAIIPMAFAFCMDQLVTSKFVDMGRDIVFYPIILTFLGIWWIGSGIVALISRDILLGGELRELLNNQLQITRCRNCSYSLIGQQPVDGKLRCPECGTPTTLELLGITEDDLIPPA